MPSVVPALSESPLHSQKLPLPLPVFHIICLPDKPRANRPWCLFSSVPLSGPNQGQTKDKQVATGKSNSRGFSSVGPFYGSSGGLWERHMRQLFKAFPMEQARIALKSTGIKSELSFPDSSHQLQNFTCVTQDFNDVNCTWIEASTDDFGYSYKFCYTASTSSTTECSVTEDKRATLKLFSFNSVRIEITTLHSSGGVGSPIATNSFLLTEKNISFIPPTPKIHSLTPNYITDKLDLEWYDGGSAFPYEIDATWEIQILRKDPMVEVALKTYHSKLTRKNTLLHWTWTSDLPFNCTTHYVRIRCFLHENAFAGSKKWSEWSQIESIPGHDTGFFEAVYPTDRVVPVGSNITFCCVVQNGHTWTDLKYSSCPPQNCPIEILSKWSISIHAPNVQFHEPSGNNAWCLIKNSTTPPPGTVLFVGLPPDIPRNLTCETHNFKDIRCKWEEGRSTFLSGLRKTIYTLSERISGGNVTYTGESEHYQCTYPVSNNQTIYNFTVYASNSLGQSEASLQIDIRHRVHPRTPADLTVTDNGPTNLILSWNLPGSFKGIKLQCEVQVSTSNSREKLKKNLDGAENSRYTISVDTLHPYTVYNFQVRCAAAEPFFWKWSTWSKEAQHETQQAPGRLDVWREKSADGETVTIFWKLYSVSLSGLQGMVEDRKAWRNVVRGVAMGRTRLRNQQ
ncbi:Leukemia inhibitory factor receptor [Varanus komodoensis]|nr:Leukemia inhibitory factor receptor [Varanus komodoensis]